MREFVDEHFVDVLIVFLMVFFTGVALWCIHVHFDKGFEVFSAAAASTLLGAFVMKVRPGGNGNGNGKSNGASAPEEKK